MDWLYVRVRHRVVFVENRINLFYCCERGPTADIVHAYTLPFAHGHARSQLAHPLPLGDAIDDDGMMVYGGLRLLLSIRTRTRRRCMHTVRSTVQYGRPVSPVQYTSYVHPWIGSSNPAGDTEHHHPLHTCLLLRA